MSLMELTSHNFDKVMAHHDLVVVDFGAQWCAPCRSFTKVIEKLNKKYPSIIFGNVDIDKEKELAEDFHIMSVPSIMILRDRVVVFAETGALTETALSELIEQARSLDTEQLKKAEEN